jgi:hypothetical protein
MNPPRAVCPSTKSVPLGIGKRRRDGCQPLHCWRREVAEKYILAVGQQLSMISRP